MEAEITLSDEVAALRVNLEEPVDPDWEAVMVASEPLPVAVERLVEWQRSCHRERRYARSHTWRVHGWQGWREHLARRKRKARRLSSEVRRQTIRIDTAQQGPILDLRQPLSVDVLVSGRGKISTAICNVLKD